MFAKSEIRVLRLKSKLLRAKDNFSLTCRKVISSNHSEDWKELETGFLKSLEQHLAYWDEVMKSVSFCAEEFCFNLEVDNDATQYNFEEFLQDLLTLNPKYTPEILSHIKMEDQLVSMFKLGNFTALKDARSTRARISKMQENNVSRGLTSRRLKIKKNQKLLVKQQKGIMNGVQDTIMRAYNKAAARRKAEFKKLWVKYVRLGRELDTLHLKENMQLKDLEFKKLQKVKYGQFVNKKSSKGKDRSTEGNTIQKEFQRRLWEDGKL